MQRMAKVSQPINDKKIVGIIAVLVLLGLVLILMTNVTSTVLSGARAFVDGESIWSKAQKEASLSLVRYLQEQNPASYANFEASLQVIEGYSAANRELAKEDPNLQVIREGFGRGRSNKNDVDDAVWIYQNLSWTPSMQQADAYWTQGEQRMDSLTALARNIHRQVRSGDLSQAEIERYMQRIYALDKELTQIESNFSLTVSRSTIRLSRVVYWATIIIGLILLIAGGIVCIRFMRSVKRWGDSVSASEKRFRDVLENTQDVVYRLNRAKGEYVYMSPSVEQMLGYSVEEVLKGGPEFIFDRIHPEDLANLQREIDEVSNNRSMQNFNDETEFRIKTKSGIYIWVSNKRSIIADDEGNATDIVGSVRDISERKKYEKKIDDSLEEKKILLQEIHHRVKNNLAVVSGLLYLQKEEVEGNAKEVLEKTESRIRSVAMIHEKLYGSDSLSDINLAEYIDELSAAIAGAYSSDKKKITLSKDLDPVRIELVDAVTFGLTVNELLNNAYKHAFDAADEGMVKITLKNKGTANLLEVRDNGKGLPAGFDFENSGSLGMTLIKSLTGQLDARVEIKNGEGTAFKIVF